MSTLKAKISGIVNSLRLAPHESLAQMLSDVESAIVTNPSDGLTSLGVARFTFDAGVAANRTIAPHGTGVTLPANAVIVGGFIDVNTAFTSAGGDTGTIAISVEGVDDIVAAAAVSGAPYSSIGRKTIVPKANTPEATSVKASTAKEITCTVAVAALLTGKLTGFLYYVADVVST